jgi:chemotaxis response regulator CheB
VFGSRVKPNHEIVHWCKPTLIDNLADRFYFLPSREQAATTFILDEMNTRTCIRVLLVDDHAVFRQTMRSQLASYSDLEVIGEASNGAEALEMVARLSPEVVLMDIHLGQITDGLGVTRALTNQYPRMAVLGLSWDTREYVATAMYQAGALDVLAKEESPDEVYKAIVRAVASMSDD